MKGPLIGQAVELDEWQREDLDLILEVDEAGQPVWREVLWGVPRGCGKSPVAAGIGLLDLASRKDRPEVYVGSGARDQAAIVGEYAREFARNGPLRDYTKPIISGVRWDRAGGGVLRVVSADGGLQHGKFPCRIVLDELHVFTTPRREALWEAFQSALHKVSDSQLLGITTAGESKQTLLGEYYDQMLRAPVVERLGPLGSRLVCMDRDAGRLMIWWGASPEADASDPEVWYAAVPAKWLHPELERAAKTYPRSTFERLVLNRWVEGGSECPFDQKAWDNARSGVEAPPPAKAVLAWSAGPRRDSAALVACWASGESFRVRLVEAWDGVDQGVIEQELVEAAEGWVREHGSQLFVADPIQFPTAYRAVQAMGVSEYMGQRATKPGMPQTDAYMEPASSTMATLLESGRLLHEGDPVLRSHVLRCEAQATRRGWRVARPKRVGDRRADSVEAAVAAVMGVYAVEQLPDLWVDAW